MPPRAQYLRVIHLELNRIMSHLVWLGTSALDLGAISVWWYCFREREAVLDLFEMSSGQRMHTRYFQVGGVIEDIPRGWVERVREFTKTMRTRADQYARAARQERDRAAAPARHLPARRGRRCSASASPARCCAPPATRGTCARPTPYCSYDHFDFKIPVGTQGDNYDRYRVRHAEIYESCEIIDQALDGLPEGPFITEDRKVALPPRHELATSMEALIHHFKLVTEGFRVPPGEVYYPIESPRGELGCFVRSDGSSKPARVHMRDPSFVNLQATAPMDARLVHRRPDRDARDARPGARRGRPVSVDPQRRALRRTARASPAGTTPSTSTKDPAGVPDPAHDAGARGAARARSRRRWRSYPDCRSAAIPALHAAQRAARLVLARGDRAGRVRDAPDARAT